jgi:hypothetical protein
MNRKATARLIIDLALAFLLLCAYAYRIIGNAAHEWVGVSVFALFIAHNIINRQWYKTIFKGKYTLLLFFAETLSVMAVYIFVVYYALKRLEVRQRRE